MSHVNATCLGFTPTLVISILPLMAQSSGPRFSLPGLLACWVASSWAWHSKATLTDSDPDDVM